MTLAYFAHANAHVGRERTALEDFARAEHLPQGGVAAIVCDGMGGAEGGALAARVAALALVDAFRSQTTSPTPVAVRDALLTAHNAVSVAGQKAAISGMGTTAVIAWCEEDFCHVGWVGDSRMYFWREGELFRRTTDHTRVADMVARRELTPEQAVSHPQAHVLSQALGQARAIEPSVFESLPLATGDVVLLCSDGLYDMIGDDELYGLIEGRGYTDAVSSLIDEANRRGGHDNIGVAIVVAGERHVPRRGAR